MNVVLDTNILISALVYGGKPRALLDLMIQTRKITAVSSEVLIEELYGVLVRKFRFTEAQLDEVRYIVEKYFDVIEVDTVPRVVKADPDDDQILAITHHARIDYIITGDNHLLDLKSYKNIPILKPDDFLEKIQKRIS